MNVRVTATIRMPPHLLRDGVRQTGMTDEIPMSKVEAWVHHATDCASEALDAGGSLEVLIQRAPIAEVH